MDMNQLLDTLYSDTRQEDDGPFEKVAEAAFNNAISDGHGDNPFDDMSMEELMKLAHDLESAPESAPDADEAAELNKTAAAMFGGELMAHAVVHELGLIKEAVANGLCRVCKTATLDLEGSSVCSSCLGG